MKRDMKHTHQSKSFPSYHVPVNWSIRTAPKQNFHSNQSCCGIPIFVHRARTNLPRGKWLSRRNFTILGVGSGLSLKYNESETVNLIILYSSTK